MTVRFDILKTPIDGLHVLQRKPVGDERGYLERLLCMNELQDLMPGKYVEQINHTLTVSRGTVRGLHFQYPPYTETKFVSCLRGEIFDVAVDLRRGSPTFLKWHGEVLSAGNYRTFVIPDGFAHGFQALEDNCEMLYFHTAPWRHEAESGIHPQDPLLDISWPLPVVGLSPRDAEHQYLSDDFFGVLR